MHREHISMVPGTRRSPVGPHRIPAALILFALIVAGLAALAGIPASHAQGAPGVITYAGADHNIWRIGADGGDRRALTQDGLSDSPDWVPGGSQIAFMSLRDQRVLTVAEGPVQLGQIYVMGSDGSSQVRLSDGSSDDRFPEVIADGSRIVFLRNHNWRMQNGTAVRDTEIGSMRIDGSDYRIHGSEITDQRTRMDRFPARVSPDGTKIVFVRASQGKTSQIRVLDVASGRISTIPVDQDQGAAEGSVEYLWPRFDPQGRIVVVRRAFRFSVEVNLIAVDLSGHTQQTVISGLQFESLANGFDVNWAGRTVVGARSPELPGGTRPEEIYLYNLATGDIAAPLDSGHAPSFILAAGAPSPPSPSAVPATAQPTSVAGTPTPGTGRPLIDTPDPLFYQVWERVDRAVKENVAVRSWIWGPVGRAVAHEPYGPNTRLVQYFDKARMELNPATADKDAFVTNGLLVVEMLSGRVQIGPTQYENRAPATIAIGGDGTNNPAPSYAVLGRVSSLAGENKVAAALQAPITATLSNNGRTGAIAFPASERVGYFAPETGHNIPEVFFNFLNQTGKIYVRDGYHTGVVLDWVFTVGYPISEAYWTKMSIAGQTRDVMVQAYQRQILTYIPDYSPPWNVQFGNVGVQYYQWRYGHTP